MKRHLNINIVIGWILLTIILTPLPCSGQSAVLDALLVDLYSQSVFYPEKLNGYVEMNRNHYDEAFYNCLYKLRDKYYMMAMETLKSCERLKNIDEELYAKCNNENTAAQMYLWVIGIEKVLRENKRWEDTTSGRNIFIAKKYSNTISPGFWTQMQAPAVKAVKPLLSCN